MFVFCTEIQFWTTSNDVLINDFDFSTFKFVIKKGSQSTSGSSGFSEQSKQSYSQKRQLQCNLNKRGFDQLKDDIKELENQLKSNVLIRCFWKNSDHIILVFQNGLIINIIIDLEFGTINRLIFDKFLLKNLQNDHLFDVLFLENHLICVSNNNSINLLNFTRNSLSSFREFKIKKLEPIIRNVQLSSLIHRKLEKQIISNEAGTQLLIWWRNSRFDIHPWTPSVRDEDRANIYLYNLAGSRLDLYSFYCTEFDIIYVQFSRNIFDVIFCIEQRSNNLIVDLAVLKFDIGEKLQKVSSISLDVDGDICALVFSPDEEKLLLCSSNRLILIYDRLSGKVTTTKSLFVPVLVSWHYSGTFFSILNEIGQIQCFDLALSNLTFKNYQDNDAILDLSKYFKYKPYILDSSWNKKMTKLNTLKYKYKPIDSYFLLNFEKGPLVLIKFIGLVNHADEMFTPDILINSYLKLNETERAIKILMNLNWSSNGVTCLASLQHIFNTLIKQQLTPKIEDQIEKVLSSFYTVNISDETKATFGDQIQDINRRFFHHLLRFGSIDKAFKIATNINHYDLFMDLFYYLKKIGNIEFAQTTKLKALEILKNSGKILSNSDIFIQSTKVPASNINQNLSIESNVSLKVTENKNGSKIKVVHFGLI